MSNTQTERPAAEILWRALRTARRLSERYRERYGEPLDEMTRAVGIHLAIERLRSGRRIRRDPKRVFKRWLRAYAADGQRQLALARAFANAFSDRVPAAGPEEWDDSDFEAAVETLHRQGAEQAARKSWAHAEHNKEVTHEQD